MNWQTAKEGVFAVALSGGSTPRRLYEHLAGPPYRDAFPWSRTHWFWGDERFVPHGDAQSNYRMVREALLSRAPIPAINIHPIPTEGVSPEAAAVTYERELKSFYGAKRLDAARPLFDVTLLGLGPDGHTASLFPGTAVLAERDRWVAAVVGVKSRNAHHADLSGTREQPARGLSGRGKGETRDLRSASPRRRQPASSASPPDRHSVPLWRCGSSGDHRVTMSLASNQDRPKRMAAVRAIEEVEDGMIVGLGSGSTAAFAVEALAARIAKGLRVVGIPTSETTAALARRLGVPLTSFAEHRRIDVSIDGADQVERETLNLVNGLGGALLREKIVAAASDRMIVVVDETKLVDRLGANTPLPVEIVSFGWQTVLDRLATIGYAPRLRLVGDKPFTTDGGNYIVDCAIAEMPDPAVLEARLSAIIGVVESGLFIGLAAKIVVGRPTSVEVIER